MAEITPVTVLTGFLGAGKTTLLNRLLGDPRLARTAVLVNEFGEIGIDHILVESIDDDAVLLNAGCVCCTIRGDLVRVLRELLPRARRDDITRVVIETTGLADPVPILTTLMRDPAVVAAYRVDGVLTVVDAVNGLGQLLRYEEARRQVALADRIALTKTDLADPALLRRRLRELNPGAPVIEGADLQTLLGAGLFDAAVMLAELARWPEAEHHHHDAAFDAVCLTWDEPLDWAPLSAALERLAVDHGDRLLRIKGIVDLRGADRPVAVHAAGHLLHEPVWLKAWPAGEPRRSRLVFITAGLSRRAIEASLEAVNPDASSAPTAGAT